MSEDKLQEARLAEYQQSRKIETLRRQVSAQPDPACNRLLTEAVQELARRQAKVRRLESQRRKGDKAGVLLDTGGSTQKSGSTVMGAETTGIDAQVLLRMAQVPTGTVHLLDRVQTPLVTFQVKYVGSEYVRLRLTSFVEGYSAQAVDSIELTPEAPEATIHQLPTFFPERLQHVTELTRATLRVQIDDLEDVDRKSEQQSSFPIWLLARTSAYNYIQDPSTGEWLDMGRYFGAWVTPDAPEVMRLLRAAANLRPDHSIVGYQVDASGVEEQVKAIYNALKAEDITYINSVLSFGAGPGQSMQRVRLPRESLAQKSANCIDGTVLMASVLEAGSLYPGIVLVPGHAFLAWEKHDRQPGLEIAWDFVETTMIGSQDFQTALESARQTAASCQQNYEASKDLADFQILPVMDLRALYGITPME